MLRIYKDKDIIRIRLDEHNYCWFIGKLNDNNKYEVRDYFGVVPLHLTELTISDILFDDSVIEVLKKCIEKYAGKTRGHAEITNEIQKLLKDLEVD